MLPLPQGFLAFAHLEKKAVIFNFLDGRVRHGIKVFTFYYPKITAMLNIPDVGCQEKKRLTPENIPSRC
jgi:hypothetical protein